MLETWDAQEFPVSATRQTQLSFGGQKKSSWHWVSLWGGHP